MSRLNSNSAFSNFVPVLATSTQVQFIYTYEICQFNLSVLHYFGNFHVPHLLMVFLKAEQLLLQKLHMGLQVRLAQRQLVQDPAQATDVSLYQLVKGQFRLVPFIAREACAYFARHCARRWDTWTQGSHVL